MVSEHGIYVTTYCTLCYPSPTGVPHFLFFQFGLTIICKSGTSASVYYYQCKLKDKNRVGLGMRLLCAGWMPIRYMVTNYKLHVSQVF